MAEREKGLFDAEFRLRKIDSSGDPLRKLDEVIDWEIFRATLTNAFAKDTPPKGTGGRPPFDCVLRFKVLILQALYNLHTYDLIKHQANYRTKFFPSHNRLDKLQHQEQNFYLVLKTAFVQEVIYNVPFSKFSNASINIKFSFVLT